MEGNPLNEDFSLIWRSTFGKTPPLGYELRHDFHKAWIRFHSLPESKRFAETPTERETILSRANTLATECFGYKAKLWLVTGYTGDYLKQNADNANILAQHAMKEVFSWVNVREAQEDQFPLSFFAAQVKWKPGAFDWLFNIIAEDKERAIFFEQNARLVLAPYDGGFDIISLEQDKLTRLKEGYIAWISGRRDGL